LAAVGLLLPLSACSFFHRENAWAHNQP
jgi:hypothetical protein